MLVQAVQAMVTGDFTLLGSSDMSIVYQVTVQIDATVHDDWLQWMQQHHIPHVLRTGCFTGMRLYRHINNPQGKAAITYSLQYTCRSLSDYEIYRERFAEGLQQEHRQRYEGKFTASRTLLQKVEMPDQLSSH
jgi:hypothetical protein